ncbi:hypothetical protein [Oxynema aestuarii]|jgi:hypothetical protein|uniref:Uncharacterized protein n=1 Tax=Oxynema aestuarii AP17 TaxID=2064643 RepID=A0A6H1TXK6_9CYAN|nr:hypothetical protein [Oxynema aestuarii]QIZ71332.1 hypothetical protein HCG48_12670 [Oxynema aestuarii AP17]RMH77072.1 MAG: hypothetical protein D6680_06395 [Cyanobacteria bacterium J007]
MTNDEFQALKQQRQANMGAIVRRIVETEWYRVLGELEKLDPDAGEVAKAANLVGQYQVLDKLMAALSEGSLASDYEIEAPWRAKLLEAVVEGFELNQRTGSPPRRYRSLAQQVADATGLTVIED